jgi:hypothetical protein
MGVREWHWRGYRLLLVKRMYTVSWLQALARGVVDSVLGVNLYAAIKAPATAANGPTQLAVSRSLFCWHGLKMHLSDRLADSSRPVVSDAAADLQVRGEIRQLTVSHWSGEDDFSNWSGEDDFDGRWRNSSILATAQVRTRPRRSGGIRDGCSATGRPGSGAQPRDDLDLVGGGDQRRKVPFLPSDVGGKTTLFFIFSCRRGEMYPGLKPNWWIHTMRSILSLMLYDLSFQRARNNRACP